jgi:hypothetical protein
MNVKTILAIGSALGFVVFHLLVDSHYRPNADDFSGMYYASQGLPGIGYAIRFYLEWEGPFMSMIAQGLWMRALYLGVPGGVIISIIKGLMLLSSTYMYGGIIQYLTGKKDLWLALFSGALTTMTLYLITSSPDEIWHWVMGSVVYLHPLVFLQIAVGLLFRKKFMWSIFPLAYIMQSRATYAILLYGFISCITIYAWAVKTDWRKRITMANVLLLACLLIYLLAPGNERRVNTEIFDFTHYLHEYRREIRNILISFNLAKSDRLILGLMAFVPLLPTSGWSRKLSNKWVLLLPGFAYLIFVFSHALLFVYATGYGAWSRVFSLHSFLFMMTGMFYCYLVFDYWVRPRRKLRRMAKTFSGVATVLLILKLYAPIEEELRHGRAFCEAYDHRHDMITSYDGSASDTLYVRPLPESGVLYFTDFSEEATNWINRDFRRIYEIPFQIKLSKSGQTTSSSLNQRPNE